MTWNVRYFSHASRGAWASARQLERVADALAALDPRPDAVALQELEDGSVRAGPVPQLAALLHALERRGFRCRGRYFPAHRYGSLYTTGLAWLLPADGPPVEWSSGEITHVRLPAFSKLKQRRIVAGARFTPPGWDRPLDLFNTHLSLPAFFEPGSMRVVERMGAGSNQLAEVGSLLRFVGAPDRPAVVVGDLNSEPGSPVHARFASAGWARVEPDAPSAAFFHLRLRLDHAFVSPGIVATDVVRGSVDEGPFAGLSDHAPVLATLRAAAAAPA